MSAFRVSEPEGGSRWWLACGDDGVWPCEVLGPGIWPGTVMVKPTHDAAPDAWQEIPVSIRRVYDGRFNRPRFEVTS